jgi:hypothetical protein
MLNLLMVHARPDIIGSEGQTHSLPVLQQIKTRLGDLSVR